MRNSNRRSRANLSWAHALTSLGLLAGCVLPQETSRTSTSTSTAPTAPGPVLGPRGDRLFEATCVLWDEQSACFRTARGTCRGNYEVVSFDRGKMFFTCARDPAVTAPSAPSIRSEAAPCSVESPGCPPGQSCYVAAGRPGRCVEEGSVP
jgi:hypothetical protein